MRDWNTKINVTHAFTSYYSAGDFYSTLLTNNSLVTNTTVLLTSTFVVFDWPKNSFIKKPVLFRSLSTVVNSFWLGHFAMGPIEDCLWWSQAKTNAGVISRYHWFVEWCWIWHIFYLITKAINIHASDGRLFLVEHREPNHVADWRVRWKPLVCVGDRFFLRVL